MSLLSDPLDVQVLQTLAGGPLSLIDLRRAVGSPPQTTLRKHLKALTALGVLVRTREQQFPAAVTFTLSSSGAELLAAAGSVEAWLARSPGGPMSLDRPGARSAIKSLVDGWSTKMMRALAAKPLSLTELDRLLSGVNYPALERRLTAMRLAGQVEAATSRAGSTPYQATRWLREAIGPLAAAAGWESRHGPSDGKPLGRLDVEAIFLLAVPLLELPSGLSGSCRLAVDLSNGRQDSFAGAVVTIANGHPVSCASDLRVEAGAAAAGTGPAWLSALSGTGDSGIKLEGDAELAESLIVALGRLARSDASNQLPVA